MSGFGQKPEEYPSGWDSFQTSNYTFDTSTGFGTTNPEQVLDFQSFDDQYAENVINTPYTTSKPQFSYLDPTSPQADAYDTYPGVQYPSQSGEHKSEFDEEEPPLLEELGIFPDRIMGKTLMVLNPFHHQNLVDANMLYETDLAGPAVFCFLLGTCLLFAGAKAHFSYLYGLSVISCILMYCLLSLMTTRGNITFGSVASVLGYCLLPVTILSSIRIFLALNNPFCVAIALVAVLWSSLSASKLFVTMSEDSQQRPLIAYPCALLYGSFALIIVF